MLAQALASDNVRAPTIGAIASLPLGPPGYQILRQRLAQDIQAVEATNAEINDLNARVLPIVTAMTGKDLGAEPEKWKAWWTDQLGYAFQQASTDEQADVHRVRRLAELVGQPRMLRRRHPGAHDRRPAAIESIQVGDRVLAQDTTTARSGSSPC